MVTNSNKRGQLNSLVPVIMVILLTAVVMAIGLYTIDYVGDVTSETSVSVVNETVATVNGTAHALAGASECRAAAFSVSAVLNASSNTTVPATNYTVDATAGTILANNASQTDWYGYDWKVTYTYTQGFEACEATATTAEGIVDFSDWIGIIIIVLAASIVIVLLTRSFGGGRRGI